MFVNTKIAHRCENYDLPPSACVGSPRDANFPSESAVPFVSRGFNFGAASVFHGSYFTANTVGLWLHSSGNGLHKKEVNPHVGTRPGPWHVDAAEFKKVQGGGEGFDFAAEDP